VRARIKHVLAENIRSEVTMMTVNEKAIFIVGNRDDKSRIAQVESALNPFDGESICDQSLRDSVVLPITLRESIRFNYTYSEILEIATRFTGNTENDIQRVMRYALVYSGLTPENNDAVYRSISLDKGYSVNTRLPRFTASITNKRLSIRCVPPIYDKVQKEYTPFSLSWRRGALHIECNGTSIFPNINKYFLGTGTAKVLSYLTSRGNSGTYNLTGNPIQRCTHECRMCCRGFYDMTSSRKMSLINMLPDEFAKYLYMEYAYLGFENISEIAFVTGLFENVHVLFDYAKNFLRELNMLSKGKFNPILNAHQRLKISSCLIRDSKAMKEFQAIGVKRFMHTIEALDTTSRFDLLKVYKESASDVAKGKSTVNDEMAILLAAADVFGFGNVEPVLIIGLDVYDKTRGWICELHNQGFKILTRSMFNVYNTNQFEYYRMQLEEIICLSELIRKLFVSGHRSFIGADVMYGQTHVSANGEVS